jgi:TFIIF-interacting CTD phosphatase-like protein
MPLTDKTLVLDLDSTLIFTTEDFEQYMSLELYSKPEHNHLRNRLYKFDVIDVVDKPGTGVKSSMWGILRPHVYEFLDFCFEYFENVIVWSAGQLRYVHAICDVLFIDPEKQPILIYSYEDCDRNDNFLFKPLIKISQEEFPEITLDKCIILDDNEMTFSKNKDNALHIPPYEPELTPKGIMQEDDALLNLTRWLMKPEVINCRDVRKTNKLDCFTCQDDYDNIETYFKI